jgi:phosphopantetheinyl transferase
MTLRAVKIRSLHAPIPDTQVARLTAGEQERLSSFKKGGDQWRFVTGCRLTRSLLNQALGRDNWSLSPSDRGRPEVQSGSHVRIDINIAHSADLVVGALVESGRIGIDVEMIEALHDYSELATSFLHSTEIASLHRQAPERRQEAATRFWVLKEAILKCDGIGFGVDPRTLRIHPPAAEGEWCVSQDLEVRYAWMRLAGKALVGLARSTNVLSTDRWPFI